MLCLILVWRCSIWCCFLCTCTILWMSNNKWLPSPLRSWSTIVFFLLLNTLTFTGNDEIYLTVFLSLMISIFIFIETCIKMQHTTFSLSCLFGPYIASQTRLAFLVQVASNRCISNSSWGGWVFWCISVSFMQLLDKICKIFLILCLDFLFCRNCISRFIPVAVDCRIKFFHIKVIFRGTTLWAIVRWLISSLTASCLLFSRIFTPLDFFKGCSELFDCEKLSPVMLSTCLRWS